MGQIWIYIVIGFFAQIIDGALGMAYGVCATSFLLSSGLSPAVASASVHLSEVFTTFVSGISHLSFKNVDKKLLKKLVIPGIIGGVVGAYILSNIPGDKMKPFINVYLLLMGGIILIKAVRKISVKEISGKKVFGLGLIGGFFDAIGGGGWGPMVTSTLVAMGYNPRLVIGTVNLAEFFVTICQVATFITILGFTNHLSIIVGLAIGGVIAAPLAALVCKRLPAKLLMILVGCLIVIVNLRALILVVF